MAGEHETVILPRSRIVKVAFELALPEDASLDDIDAWAAYALGYRGSLPLSNPLVDCEIEAVSAPVLTDTEMHLHVRIGPPDGEGRQRINRWRDPAPFTGPAEIDQIVGGCSHA